MSENYKIYNNVLSDVDANVLPKVKDNGHIVQTFLKELKESFKEPDQNKDFDFHIMHGGSAYESLAVEEKADFDITLSLQGPYASENFNIDRDSSGYFKLKWKSNTQNQRLADSKGYLQSSELRRRTFKYLRQRVEKINMPGKKLNCYDADNSFSVTIRSDTGQKISVDLVPQIACRTWGQCEDLKPLHDMPVSLRRYIDTLNKNKSPVMFFSLGIPDAESFANKDQLFNVSFSMLEKNYIRENPEIRDMVRLVKCTAKHYEWNKVKDRNNVMIKFPIKSFHAKRVAIKYHDQLKGKTPSEGYKDLLGYIAQEIKTGTVDGYFVKDQVMKKWKPEEIKMFQKEVDRIKRMDAGNIFKGNNIQHSKNVNAGKKIAEKKFHKDTVSQKNCQQTGTSLKPKGREAAESHKKSVNTQHRVPKQNITEKAQPQKKKVDDNDRCKVQPLKEKNKPHDNPVKQRITKNSSAQMKTAVANVTNAKKESKDSTIEHKKSVNTQQRVPKQNINENAQPQKKKVDVNDRCKVQPLKEKNKPHDNQVKQSIQKNSSAQMKTSAASVTNAKKESKDYTIKQKSRCQSWQSATQGLEGHNQRPTNTSTRGRYDHTEDSPSNFTRLNATSKSYTNTNERPHSSATQQKTVNARGHCNARQDHIAKIKPGIKGAHGILTTANSGGYTNPKQHFQGSATAPKNTGAGGHAKTKQGGQNSFSTPRTSASGSHTHSRSGIKSSSSSAKSASSGRQTNARPAFKPSSAASTRKCRRK